MRFATRSFASLVGLLVAAVSLVAHAAPLNFKSPYKKGLAPVTTGPIATISNQQFIDARAYGDISKAAQRMLTMFPADKHYFIAIGRDPAPITAFLQNLGGKSLAINFPASSNNSGKATAPVLGEYVKKLVPPEILASDRTFVFFDATTSGRALDFYVPLIAQNLGGRKVIKAAFGLHFNGNSNWSIHTNPGDKVVIDTKPFPEVDRFFTAPYEDIVGEYPRHGPGQDSITVLDNPRAEYSQLRQALMQRMERDEQLHGFLSTEAGPAWVHESPEEAQARKVAEEREAKERADALRKTERAERAQLLVKSRALPRELGRSLSSLVASLPERAEGHDKGPYLSENAARMNDWLKESLVAREDGAKVNSRLNHAGPNLVVGMFMDEVENARANNRIRNRDYRRLMGHALSAATMDEAMMKSLVQRFEASKHFKREIVEESDYYLGSHQKHARPETTNMAANYQALVARLPKFEPKHKGEEE
jgi:hypothetical protein